MVKGQKFACVPKQTLPKVMFGIQFVKTFRNKHCQINKKTDFYLYSLIMYHISESNYGCKTGRYYED